MHQLTLKNIGKRYGRKWLFRHLNLTLESGDGLAVTGRNGSGKSTLLQIVYGLVQAGEGEVWLNGKPLDKPSEVFAFTAPYMELPLEYTASEILSLYRGLGKTDMHTEAFSDYSGLEVSVLNRRIGSYSSGMQQRLKTALCLSGNSPVIILDEPLTNMDAEGEKWYKNCVSLFHDRIVLVAGNQSQEYEFANRKLHLSEP